MSFADDDYDVPMSTGGSLYEHNHKRARSALYTGLGGLAATVGAPALMYAHKAVFGRGSRSAYPDTLPPAVPVVRRGPGAARRGLRISQSVMRRYYGSRSYRRYRRRVSAAGGYRPYKLRQFLPRSSFRYPYR